MGGHDWRSFRVMDCNGDRPEVLHSFSTRTFRNTKLQSPQIIAPHHSKIFDKLNLSSIPSFLLFFTVGIDVLEADPAMLHTGSLHIIALQAHLPVLHRRNHQNSLRIDLRPIPRWMQVVQLFAVSTLCVQSTIKYILHTLGMGRG